MALHYISAYSLGLAGGLSHVMQTHRIGKLTVCAGCVHHDATLPFPKLEKIGGYWFVQPIPDITRSCALLMPVWAVLFDKSLPVIVSDCEAGIFPVVEEHGKSLRVQLHVNSGAKMHRGTLEQSAETPLNIGLAA